MADTEGKSSQNSQTSSQFSQSDLPELLHQYYKRLFPYKYFVQWLSYGGVPKTYFVHREFSFTLKDDVYVRYQSFADQQELEKEILKRNPYKIDIGAVFTHKPKDHKMIKPGAFQAEEKELVFDIDMTDYDEVRTCCKGTDICKKCWLFMVVAMKIVDSALKRDFGFQHRLWVYSGRRGVHCWVCDASARKLSQNARSAVAEYLSVIKGGENQIKKVNLRTPYHPYIRHSSEILISHFVDLVIEKQDMLSCKERWDGILALVPESIRTELNASWSKSKKTSVQRWDELEVRLDNLNRSQVKDEIIFQYCFPRLDVNVTKGLNHLLKSPFCVHPKTGRVCVPISMADVDSFDPFTVPTISQLCDEIDQNEKNSQDMIEEVKKKIPAYKRTSLEKPIGVFVKFLKELEHENDERRKILREAEEKKGEW
ncbi:DNA primase small subunit-like isoform X1 [Acropora millepora]|uniref:DNA primase small subunit-like isoform X1 n=1 Tax=Acropora millepora TaxID=45264 RepID=UPI001CF5102C|nr:DNA primase small subunit-like isoform X1 [Acropora millepora]